MNRIILSTAYFPNIQYFSKIKNYDEIIIDIYESYSRQSYRNRCNILSANGLLSLSVPVCKNNHIFTKDIKIDYSTNWQKKHKMAILSAYRNSPFYAHFIDCFNFVFENKEKYLIDLNKKILENALKILKINKVVEFSADFITSQENNFRDKIHPKVSRNFVDNDFISQKYYQNFSDRFNFVPNLSILDLIFMEGNEAIIYL